MSIEKIVLITLFFELIELYFQYSQTLKDSISRLYSYYKKSPLLFFLAHPSYFWILFLSLAYSHLNFPLIIAIALKIFDIITKLELFKKIESTQMSDKGMEDESIALLEMKTPAWVYFVGLFTYPYLVYLAFS